MTDDELDSLKSQIDKGLVGIDSTKGIKLGMKLFRGFQRRGWLTHETFGAFGTEAFPVRLPAYDRTRYAIADPFIGDAEFVLPR